MPITITANIFAWLTIDPTATSWPEYVDRNHGIGYTDRGLADGLLAYLQDSLPEGLELNGVTLTQTAGDRMTAAQLEDLRASMKESFRLAIRGIKPDYA